MRHKEYTNTKENNLGERKTQKIKYQKVSEIFKKKFGL